MTNVMNERVLVLNSSWVPVNVTTVFEAVCMVFHERALVVDPETYATYSFERWVDNWGDAARYAQIEAARLIRSPSTTFVAPEIVLCRDYKGMGTGRTVRRPKFSRRNIYLRDKSTCQYCGKKRAYEDLNLDHVIPKSKGGRMDWANIVLACVACNDKKRDRTPAEAGMRLIRTPRVPDAAELKTSLMDTLKRKLGRNVPKTWEHFLGKMYWTVELHD